MRIAITLILAVLVVGCSKDPVASNATNNPKIQIEELFTHSGVTVYRFYDYGRAVYFTNASTDVQSSRSENCGKGCTRTETTRTIGSRTP